MHTTDKFKEKILFFGGILLFLIAALLRHHAILAIIFVMPGIGCLLISSFYTVKRRFVNLIITIRNIFR